MQTIRIRGTKMDFDVQEMCFPFIENSIFYIRMIEVDKEDNPTHFLSIVPQDILWRRSTYDEEIMKEILQASDNAHHEQVKQIAEMEETIKPNKNDVNDECKNYYG